MASRLRTVSAPSSMEMYRPAPAACFKMAKALCPAPALRKRRAPSSSTVPSGMPSWAAIFPAMSLPVPVKMPQSWFSVRYTPRS